MDNISQSNGVLADSDSGDSSGSFSYSPRRRRMNRKPKSTASMVLVRVIFFLLLVAASVFQMLKDKSSYVRSGRTAQVHRAAATKPNVEESQVPKRAESSQAPQQTTTESSSLSSEQKQQPRDVKAAFANWTRPYWNRTDLNFTFPDVSFRLQYYMGSWYNQTLEVADCSGLESKFINGKFADSFHDRNVLYSYGGLNDQIRTSKHWNVPAYLAYYHKVMRNASMPNNTVVAMCVGDSSSLQPDLPVAAKTRQAGYLEDASKYFGIIWPLNMVRHFGPVDEYMALATAGNVTPWEAKKEALIWRGGYTGIPQLLKHNGYKKSMHKYGPRVQAVLANRFQNQSEIDVAFLNMLAKKNGVPASLNKTLQQNCVRDSYSSMQDQLEFKYILNVEGNDVSSGLKWQLASNSVVFMAKPMTVSWAMEDLLIPFYHYIPVDDNFENLAEMIHWAKTHDDEAKKIADQSTQYMIDLWISEQAQRDHAELHTLLATRYESQFSKALWQCIREPPKKRERFVPYNNNNNINNGRSSLTRVQQRKNGKIIPVYRVKGKYG